MFAVLESLEPRTLMSAAPVSPQVTLDRAAIHADLLKFRADIAAGAVSLLADCQALQVNGLNKDATLSPLFKTLRADVKSMQARLVGDRLNLSGAVLKDLAAMAVDGLRMLFDTGNAKALQADRAKLLAHQVALQNDEIASLTARITTRQNALTALTGDLQAIADAVQSKTNASPKLVADAQKFVADRSSILNVCVSTLATIQAGRAQLAADLMAMQSR